MTLATPSSSRSCLRSIRTARTHLKEIRFTSSLPPSLQQSTVASAAQENESIPSQRETADLPASKLRALISLYHKSADYITPETLNDRITEAFVKPRLPESLGPGQYARPQIEYSQLRDHVSYRRKIPRLASTKVESHFRATVEPFLEDPIDFYESRTDGTWSLNRTTREQKVVNALYGVKGFSDRWKAVLPGLEMLQEESQRVQKSLEDAKKTFRNLQSTTETKDTGN